MAKNRRSRRDNYSPNHIANRRLPSFSTSYVAPALKPYTPLTLYEDRRTWHPELEQRPAASFSQARHRLTLLEQPQRSPPRQNTYSPWRSSYIRQNFNLTQRIAFQQPQRVLICVRRSVRREIMHALKKAGRGGQKRPRRTFYSSVSCRR